MHWLHSLRDDLPGCSHYRIPRKQNTLASQPSRNLKKRRISMARELLKGNIAMAEAAIRAGMHAYFGYPITPQTEVLEYLSWRMPNLNRVFLQGESEIAVINMVYGAACAGVRVMTSSSGPGMSLMQEGLSYIACSEVPVVIIDVMRGGPGLGNIQPTQADYNMLTKSAGHGDFHSIVLAPSTIQEAVDMVGWSFNLAEKYRTIVIIAADGMIGQMMEPAELPPMQEPRRERPDWAVTGAKGRKKNTIYSFYLGVNKLEQANLRFQAKFQKIKENEVRFEEVQTEDAELLLVAFGTAGRMCKSALAQARQKGVRVGLLRPITLSPFPEKRIAALAQRVKTVLTVEMDLGQMVDDVRLAVEGRVPVHFYGRTGGEIPMVDDILENILTLAAISEMAA
jgi:2-oxoglutarate/2-oxoacid ferredoxin oxidoreductase subunit alpha